MKYGALIIFYVLKNTNTTNMFFTSKIKPESMLPIFIIFLLKWKSYLITYKINYTVSLFYVNKTCSINDICDLHNMQREEVSIASKQDNCLQHTLVVYLFNSFLNIFSGAD